MLIHKRMKNYEMVDQLLSGPKANGRLAIIDNGFPIVNLLKESASGTQIIATQRGNTKHLPKIHKDHLSQAKNWRGNFPKRKHIGITTMLSYSLTMELHRAKNVRTQSMSTRVERDQLFMFPWLLDCA